MEAAAEGRLFDLRRAFSVPKYPGERNEDSYAMWRRKGHFALSDGASISYDSAAWAQILVRRFVSDPDFSPAWLDAAVVRFSAKHDRDSLPWMKQAAFDRGSFASLLSVRLSAEPSRARVFAIGDTVAMLCDGEELVQSFPYSEPDQFDASPQLLSTNPAENRFLREAEPCAEFVREWDLAGLERPMLLCMTDALGQWFLLNRVDAPRTIFRLIQRAKPIDFQTFVDEQRAAGVMHRDDTTLLAFW
jgi:hypothetical protein